MKNVYDDPAYAKVRKQMHKKLEQMQKMYKDPIEETIASK
jgi:predicted secreted Zn-dependent protease